MGNDHVSSQRERIWLNVGDDYEDIPFDSETPCKLDDGTLILLREVRSRGIKTFKVWRGNSWESTFFSRNCETNISLTVQTDKELSTDQERALLYALDERLNDKTFLISQNLNHIKVVILQLVG